MKRLFLFFIFCTLLPSLNAQHLNHITVYVVDIAKSVSFYKNVMGFNEIPEPFHDGRHTWFKIGEHNELHVVSGAKEMIPHDINIHMAFSVSSVEDFAKHLKSMNIKYGDWSQISETPRWRKTNLFPGPGWVLD